MEKGSTRQALTVKVNLGNYQNMDLTGDTTINVEGETREELLTRLAEARSQAIQQSLESLQEQKKVLEEVIADLVK